MKSLHKACELMLINVTADYFGELMNSSSICLFYSEFCEIKLNLMIKLRACCQMCVKVQFMFPFLIILQRLRF